MNQPLIYKYSPKNINEFIMDKNLLEILKTFIKIDSLNILFVGNSGSGKTTLINLLIQEYYQNNYDPQNILIINSLKDQGISYYRNEVKTFCQTICNIPNKKKIIVLDDIDTINEQSQQVFRNCIDKYSNNIHFIASCNNIQKVIESLQSRIMIIKLLSIEKKSFEKIYEKICLNENIILEEKAKTFILTICNNSIRILLNYMEKFKLLSRKITYETVLNICTNISFCDFENYTKLCTDKKNLSSAIQLIYSIFDKGYSVIDIFDNYFIYIKINSIIDENKKYLIIK